MIKSIELINWKTHKSTVMNFQKGVNVLIGVMGAGKSSVIDGISFGLFGTFPNLNHKRTTVENLISSRPNLQDNAEIRLKFTIGTDEYTVIRKIKKKEPASATLEKNGNYLQAQPVKVNEEIENLMKIDYDTFSRAIYAEQNRIDYFLELTKSERKRQIDQMLGLDNFANAEDNATSLINNIKATIADEEQVLAQIDARELKLQLEKLTTERTQMDSELKNLQKESQETQSKVDVLQNRLVETKSKYDTSKKLEKEIAEISSKIETLNKEAKKIEELGIDPKTIESEFTEKNKLLQFQDAEIKELRKSESEITKKLGDSSAVVRLNEKKLLERNQLTESIKGMDVAAEDKKLQEIDLQLHNYVKELSSLKGRKEDIKKWAAELRDHISKCPVCERELSDDTRKILLEQKNSSLKEIETNMGALDDAIKVKDKELSSSKKTIESLKLSVAKLADYNNVDAILSKERTILKESKDSHDKIAEQIEKTTKERDKLNNELDDIKIKREAIVRKSKYDIEIVSSTQMLEKKKANLKEVNFDEKELYNLQDMITKESSKLSDVKAKITSNERYIKNIALQVDEKAKSIANINSIQQRIESKRIHLGNMNRFRAALVETEAQLRNNLIMSINSLMQDVWSKLYPYADYSTIKLNAKKDDYTLEASVSTNGEESEWIEMDGIASGGERSIACLTMRIALAMVIVPNLKWLILDEPTHNIDENGIEKFIEVLGSTLPNFVEQIFIITHDNALKNISSARVYQLDRNKNKNEYTSAVEL
jgi:DNA repair protein SbcC/Rad50